MDPRNSASNVLLMTTASTLTIVRPGWVNDRRRTPLDVNESSGASVMNIKYKLETFSAVRIV